MYAFGVENGRILRKIPAIGIRGEMAVIRRMIGLNGGMVRMDSRPVGVAQGFVIGGNAGCLPVPSGAALRVVPRNAFCTGVKSDGTFVGLGNIVYLSNPFPVGNLLE